MPEIVFNCPECGAEVRTRYRNRKFCEACAERRRKEAAKRADAKRKEKDKAARRAMAKTEDKELVHNEEIYFHDSPEDIQKCLNCTKPKCNDCLH